MASAVESRLVNWARAVTAVATRCQTASIRAIQLLSEMQRMHSGKNAMVGMVCSCAKAAAGIGSGAAFQVRAR